MFVIIDEYLLAFTINMLHKHSSFFFSFIFFGYLFMALGALDWHELCDSQRQCVPTQHFDNDAHLPMSILHIRCKNIVMAMPPHHTLPSIQMLCCLKFRHFSNCCISRTVAARCTLAFNKRDRDPIFIVINSRSLFTIIDTVVFI